MKDQNIERNRSKSRNKSKSQNRRKPEKDKSEQVKDLYYELNPEEKYVKKKVDFDQTLDNFQHFLEQKNQKIEEQKQQKEQDEELEFPEKEFDQEQFLQREEEFLKRKQKKQEELRQQLEKERKDKEHKATFKPEINPNSMKRNIDDLINWKLNKEKKQKEAKEDEIKKLTKKQQNEYNMNNRFRKVSTNTRNSQIQQLPVSERLYQYQSVYSKNKKKKEIEIYGEEKKKKIIEPSVSSINQPSRMQSSFYTNVTTQTRKKSYIKDLEDVEKELFQPEDPKIETYTWKAAEKERKRKEKEQKRVKFDKNTKNNKNNDQKKSLIKMFESRTNLLYDNNNFKPYEGPNNFEQDNKNNQIMNLQSFGDIDQSIYQPNQLKMPEGDINDIKASFKQLERLQRNQENPFKEERDQKVKQYFDQYTPGEKYVFQNMPEQEEQENNSFFSQDDVSEVPQGEVDKEYENHLDPEIGQIPSFKKTFLMQEYLDPDRQEEEKSNLRQPKRTMTDIYDEQVAQMERIKRKKEEKLEKKKKLLEKTFRQRRQTNQYGKIHNEKILKVTQFNYMLSIASTLSSQSNYSRAFESTEISSPQLSLKKISFSLSYSVINFSSFSIVFIFSDNLSVITTFSEFSLFVFSIDFFNSYFFGYNI